MNQQNNSNTDTTKDSSFERAAKTIMGSISVGTLVGSATGAVLGSSAGIVVGAGVGAISAAIEGMSSNHQKNSRSEDDNEQ